MVLGRAQRVWWALNLRVHSQSRPAARTLKAELPAPVKPHEALHDLATAPSCSVIACSLCTACRPLPHLPEGFTSLVPLPGVPGPRPSMADPFLSF